MKFLKYFSIIILASVVKSDSEDICTIKSFKRPSETDARSSNGIELQFLASYGKSVKSKQEWKWDHQCSASVLTKTTLLTAAHCVREFDKQKNRVVVGAKDLNSDTPSNSRQERGISRVVIHPDYDDVTAYFDVAIIHTDEEIDFDYEFGVKPACLSNLTSKSTDFLHNEVTRMNLEKIFINIYQPVRDIKKRNHGFANSLI